MADENVTEPENITETAEQAATPAAEGTQAAPQAPKPTAMPKPHAPSPAAFAAKKTPTAHVAAPAVGGHAADAVKQAAGKITHSEASGGHYLLGATI